MNEKTSVEHWDGTWTERPRPRLPSGFEVGSLGVQSVLRQHIRPAMSVLEIGCAPGKMLSWVAAGLHAKISGIDYSPKGIAITRWLMKEMGIDADIRQEDVFRTSFAPSSFDVVYSNGVIEHFSDPRELVRVHVTLVKPGGVAVVVIPNYGGIYGRIQRRFDPENLAIHNLEIMSESALLGLVPAGEACQARAYRFGRASPWIVSLQKRWGRAGLLLSWMLNFLSLALPIRIGALSPILVLEIRREHSDAQRCSDSHS